MRSFFAALSLLPALVSAEQESLKPLIDYKQIAAKIAEVAPDLDREYADKDLVILMVLKGSICLAADLIRSLQIKCNVETVQCRSYRGETTRGDLEIIGLERLCLEDRDVLIVDDIYDSGHTLTALINALQGCKTRSIKSLVLLAKDVPHVGTIRPDYVLFDIENQFVVGYGLDYQERYRGLPGVYILQQE